MGNLTVLIWEGKIAGSPANGIKACPFTTPERKVADKSTNALETSMIQVGWFMQLGRPLQHI
jgi:hypothetical protein